LNYSPIEPAVKITMNATIKAKIIAMIPLTVRLRYNYLIDTGDRLTLLKTTKSKISGLFFIFRLRFERACLVLYIEVKSKLIICALVRLELSAIVIAFAILSPIFLFEAQAKSFADPIALSYPELISLNIADSGTTSPYRMVKTTLSNAYEHDLPYVVFVEIRDSYGITLYLQFHTGVLGGTEYTELGSSWRVPYEVGTYELRAFAISNFTKPEVIVNVRSINATVIL
jgi:hypothetical protein